jgi:hypothetical protein
MMEAVRTSETSIYSNETTRRYIPEGSTLHTCHRDNLKSYKLLPIRTLLGFIRTHLNKRYQFIHITISITGFFTLPIV